jgi:hypothetical protein
MLAVPSYTIGAENAASRVRLVMRQGFEIELLRGLLALAVELESRRRAGRFDVLADQCPHQ